jgi:hypothetical protein
MLLAVNPAGADDGEFWAADFGRELGVGERSGVRLAPNALLETFKVLEAENLTTAHEVDDLAGGAIDGVHADEVSFLVDADGVEAVVNVGLHEVEGVLGVAEGPALVVGEDGRDVIELRGGDVGARGRLCGEEEGCENEGKKHRMVDATGERLPQFAVELS